MPRRASFPFYPGDWRGNAKLRAVPLQLRGVWIEVMCLFADSDEFGLLRWDLRRLAPAIPCHVHALQSLIDYGILKGASTGERSVAVTHVDRQGATHTVLEPQNGPIWFSTRMLTDEFKRLTNQRNGRKGGNPLLRGATVNPSLNPSGLPPSPLPLPEMSTSLSRREREFSQALEKFK